MSLSLLTYRKYSSPFFFSSNKLIVKCCICTVLFEKRGNFAPFPMGACCITAADGKSKTRRMPGNRRASFTASESFSLNRDFRGGAEFV